MTYKVFSMGVACLALGFSLYALSTVLAKVPRLEGIGCLNAGGPLYANEEDSFPPCDTIRPYKRSFFRG
jgi:hypothetical protein